MDIYSYNGVLGAKAQQTKMDIISNNMANIQTEGFKSQSAGFMELLYENMDAAPPNQGDLTEGNGTKVGKTDINFEPGAFMYTSGNFDYAIEGEGYFALYNGVTANVSYTRNGSFHMSQVNEGGDFYLAAQNGDLVLDPYGQLIPIESSSDEPAIGVFDFANKEGILLQGNNVFQPVPKNGEPIPVEEPRVKRGYIESSNVELSYEMSKVIEAQRAYQMALKLVKTGSEIGETINNLRQG